MIIKTRIFKFCDGNYKNLSELAQAMGISVSQIYRVRENKRSINQKFIIGAIKAFPEHKFEDLFYLAPDSPIVTDYYRQDPIEKETTKEKAESTQQTLENFASAVDEYGQHIRSHTSAITSLREAVQEIRNSVKEANKILGFLYRHPPN